MRRLLKPCCYLAAMLWLVPMPVRAVTPADLVDRGDLSVRTLLSPQTGVVPGQQLRLQIEVATVRWFTGGTRISIPEVPGLVILQTEQFASNASEQRGGETWVIQRWTLDLYPQRPGPFEVPPLALTVNVSAGGADTASGPVMAPGIEFEVTMPQTLETLEHWVAAPSYRVSQSFDRSLEDLAVGDAVERTVRFEASDVMAMMLPALPAQALEGVAAYPLPPTLENRSNRGEMIAQRVETISYVMQSEGDFRLPAAEFAWWDTSQGELKLLNLEEVTFSVQAGGTAADNGAWRLLSMQQWVAVSVAVLVLAGAALLLFRLLARLPRQKAHAAWSTARQRVRALRQPALPPRLNPGSSAGE